MLLELSNVAETRLLLAGQQTTSTCAMALVARGTQRSCDSGPSCGHRDGGDCQRLGRREADRTGRPACVSSGFLRLPEVDGARLRSFELDAVDEPQWPGDGRLEPAGDQGWFKHGYALPLKDVQPVSLDLLRLHRRLGTEREEIAPADCFAENVKLSPFG